MKTKLALQSSVRFANRLKKLHAKRVDGKIVNGARRKTLTKFERKQILEKTGGRCHICGDMIKKDEHWQVDHILAHSSGGGDSIDNYLPAHPLCNNYRRRYSAEEFQWIMKLGVWARTKIEKRTELGINIADKFIRHEKSRISRQRTQ